MHSMNSSGQDRYTYNDNHDVTRSRKRSDYDAKSDRDYRKYHDKDYDVTKSYKKDHEKRSRSPRTRDRDYRNPFKKDSDVTKLFKRDADVRRRDYDEIRSFNNHYEEKRHHDNKRALKKLLNTIKDAKTPSKRACQDVKRDRDITNNKKHYDVTKSNKHRLLESPSRYDHGNYPHSKRESSNRRRESYHKSQPCSAVHVASTSTMKDRHLKYDTLVLKFCFKKRKFKLCG